MLLQLLLAHLSLFACMVVMVILIRKHDLERLLEIRNLVENCRNIGIPNIDEQLELNCNIDIYRFNGLGGMLSDEAGMLGLFLVAPFIGPIVGMMVFFPSKKTLKTIDDHYDKATEFIINNERYYYINKLPNDCKEILDSIDKNKIILKNLNYCNVVINESYSLLLETIEHSFIDKTLPEQSKSSLAQSLFEYDVFLSEMIKKAKTQKEEEFHNSEKVISEYNSTFQELVKKMSTDLKKGYGEF